MLLPADTPVTTPVLLMVATPVLELVHGVVADGVPEPLNVKLAPMQPCVPPVMVGAALTVTVTLFEQPASLVKVMVAEPAPMAVIKPVLLTVATPGLELVHGLEVAGVPVAVKVLVLPMHKSVVPEITGNA